MKLSFIPADLHLVSDDGEFKVTLEGTEVFRSSSSTKAVKKFREIKKGLEERFPAHDLSDEEKKELLQRAIGDALVQHNSVRPERKAINRTRTFG